MEPTSTPMDSRRKRVLSSRVAETSLYVVLLPWYRNAPSKSRLAFSCGRLSNNERRFIDCISRSLKSSTSDDASSLPSETADNDVDEGFRERTKGASVERGNWWRGWDVVVFLPIEADAERGSFFQEPRTTGGPSSAEKSISGRSYEVAGAEVSATVPRVEKRRIKPVISFRFSVSPQWNM